jgi:hypothetical protein
MENLIIRIGLFYKYSRIFCTFIPLEKGRCHIIFGHYAV